MEQKSYKSYAAKRKLNNALVYIFLSVLAFIWVFPIFWVLITSFSDQKGRYIATIFPKSLYA